MTDPNETANLVAEITDAYREHAAEENTKRPLTYHQAMDLGLTEKIRRYEELSDRNMMARSIANLKARGEYDQDRHPDPAEYQPLTAAEHLEMIALGEAIGFYYRHPSQVDGAARAGATWAQLAAARNTTEAAAQTAYRQWAAGQHTYASMSDVAYREALELAGPERDLGMVIRSLSADSGQDVLLTLVDRHPDLTAQALADCARTWDPDGPDVAAAREG